ncbi:nucleotide exchange factor GrpE [Fuchsiella alkaliacetigena]|uniref:nucleotide exchange factor GrpE n=1 Tax=Fuchsiella alkaliacetigena TaxID=957042 RepID=UPI002009DD52|nr:nucleotide exchange factor GrpE [Fuchsiella alkaliacetigena]MCK8825746.1 nucleotide exchange factor GrpE [Fuchsiella alkaliacetigena]
MLSKLWNKLWSKESSELNKLEILEERLEDLHNKVVEIDNNSKQMIRLQYKNNQDLAKKLKSIENRIKEEGSQADKVKELEEEIQKERSIANENIDFLISFVDEIDLITSKISNDQDRWRQLLEKWREQILKKLSKQGVYEVKLANTEFNPRLAEAIDTLNEDDLAEGEEYNNYEIVKIFKRAYRDEQGEIIRKAIVNIFKEGS